MNWNNWYRILYIKSMLSRHVVSDIFVVSVPGSMQRLSLKALTCHSGIREGCTGIAAKTTCCGGWGRCYKAWVDFSWRFVWEIRIDCYLLGHEAILLHAVYTRPFSAVKRFLQNFRTIIHMARLSTQNGVFHLKMDTKGGTELKQNWIKLVLWRSWSQEDRQWLDHTFFWVEYRRGACT